MSKLELSDELKLAIGRIKTDVDRELAIFFDMKIAEAGKLDPQYKRLLQEMKKFALRGGKRLRPFMAWLGWQIAGGKNYDHFIQTVMAWELYHNFAIIHDDIMDNDDTRYGGPNIKGAYERLFRRSHSAEVADLHARNMALLAGDIAVGLTIEVLQNAPYPPEIKDRLQRDMLKLHFSLAGGQMLDDLAVITRDMNLAKIRKVYLYKTARYSMVAPMQSGAILAGANDTILNIIERYGVHAGIAYQITDDLLGMYGTAKEIGKPTITDLREKKKTILMYYGLQFANAADKAVLLAKWGNPRVTSSDLKLVRKILNDNGAKAKTIFLAQAEAVAAKKAIGKLAMPGELPKLFEDFTDYLVSRSA